MKHACKFKRGDSVTLIRTLETRSGARRKRVVYPKGTTFTIGDIRLRHRNVETSSDDAYELYNYTLVDEDNNTVAVVGQYMFDTDVAGRHAYNVRKLKKLCSKYHFIIGTKTLISISLLVGAIGVVMLGLVRALMNQSFEVLDLSYIIVAACLFGLFIVIQWIESIKYPKGLERTLMDRAKTQSKLVYCNYDYDSMAVIGN